MVYQWKVNGVIPVDAQTAGNELTRIYNKHGKLSPSDVVNESRNDSAPLHKCFEWNDKKAAEKYRESQAQQIICLITTVEKTAENTPVEVRAFVNVNREYQPISVVMNDEEKRKSLLKTALSELSAFQRKYQSLEELNCVFSAISEIKEVNNNEN